MVATEKRPENSLTEILMFKIIKKRITLWKIHGVQYYIDYLYLDSADFGYLDVKWKE